MKNPKYLLDNYKKEFETTVSSVKDDKFVVFEDTIFYPNAGGQPFDTGKIKTENNEYNVVFVGKFGDNISHEIDSPGLKVGDKVSMSIDWDRRYKLMRMHTAAHVLSRVMFEETGAHTSGNQLGTEKSRIDFTLDEFDKENIPSWIEKSNKIISKNIPIEKTFMNREDALKIEGFAGPSPHLMKGFETLRVVNINGVDAQPCGGTHLDNTSEIGKLIFLKAENKGKNNRRIYYSVE